MTHYDSTARVPFAKGGKVGQKKSPVKRIILWKGKAKDWPGAKEAARQTRNRKATGGSVDDKLRKLGKEIKANPLPSKTKSLLKQLKKSYARRKYKKGGKAKDSVHQPTTHSWWLLNRNKRDKKAKGGKADKNWIQGVNKSIKKRGTKGVCTGKKFGSASCKPGSRRYNLAKTFKKMARAKHASGGLVRYI